jgi:hypothetical protein
MRKSSSVICFAQEVDYSKRWLSNLKVWKGGMPPLFVFAQEKKDQSGGVRGVPSGAAPLGCYTTLPDLRYIATAHFLSGSEVSNDFLCKASVIIRDASNITTPEVSVNSYRRHERFSTAGVGPTLKSTAVALHRDLMDDRFRIESGPPNSTAATTWRTVLNYAK